MTFEEWLVSAGYRQTSVKSSLRMLRRIRELVERGPMVEVLTEAAYTPYIRRWLAYADVEQLSDPFTLRVRSHYNPVTPAPKTKDRREEPLTHVEWQGLLNGLKVSRPIDRSLYVIVHTRYPAADMSDLIDLPLGELKKLVPPEVAKLLDTPKRKGIETLHDFVCSECTAGRVYRKLLDRLQEFVFADFQAVERMPVEKRWAPV